jgi:hypothetical protein
MAEKGFGTGAAAREQAMQCCSPSCSCTLSRIHAIIWFPLAVAADFIVGGWNGVLKWTPVAEASVAVVHLAESVAK